MKRNQVVFLLSAPVILAASCAGAIVREVRVFASDFITRWKYLGD